MDQQAFGGFKIKIATDEQVRDFRARGHRIVSGDNGVRLVAYQLPNGGDVLISNMLELTTTPLSMR